MTYTLERVHKSQYLYNQSGLNLHLPAKLCPIGKLQFLGCSQAIKHSAPKNFSLVRNASTLHLYEHDYFTPTGWLPRNLMLFIIRTPMMSKGMSFIANISGETVLNQGQFKSGKLMPSQNNQGNSKHTSLPISNLAGDPSVLLWWKKQRLHTPKITVVQ